MNIHEATIEPNQAAVSRKLVIRGVRVPKSVKDATKEKEFPSKCIEIVYIIVDCCA